MFFLNVLRLTHNLQFSSSGHLCIETINFFQYIFNQNDVNSCPSISCTYLLHTCQLFRVSVFPLTHSCKLNFPSHSVFTMSSFSSLNNWHKSTIFTGIVQNIVNNQIYYLYYYQNSCYTKIELQYCENPESFPTDPN